MNASAAVLQSMALNAWSEPRYSARPTLVLSALTLLALLVIWLAVSSGWPVLSADFGRPPAGGGEPLQAPAPFERERPRERHGPPSSVTYFVVASDDQEAYARSLIALAATEQAHGLCLAIDDESVLRRVDSPAVEAALEAELSLATDAWAGQHLSVKVMDLR
jgi:hypothetical protein